MNQFERWALGEITTAECLLHYQKEIIEREEVPPSAAIQIAESMIDDYEYMREVYK